MQKRLTFLAVSAILVAIAVAFVLFRPRPQTVGEPVWESVRPENDVSFDSGRRETAAVESPIRFAMVTSLESGIDFEYYGNPSDEHYMTEQNGGGVAL